MTRLKVAYVPTHLPTYYADEYAVFQHSASALQRLADDLDFELSIKAPIVTKDEAERTASELTIEETDFALLQSSTFAMGDVLLPFVGRSFRLGLWATEEPTKAGPIMLNNFVSMNLHAGILTRYIQHENVRFKWFYGSGDHEWFRPRLEVTVLALKALRRLANARIALVGGIAPTFYNFAFDERKLRARFGLVVDPHELDGVFARAERQEPQAVERVVRDLTEVASGRVEISMRDLQTSAAAYLALKELADEHGYDALAVSDWPRFQSALGIHPGMAFSWLDEHDGIPVASEGDVLGATSMLMANAVSGRQSMLLDMNDLDFDADAVLMWHCGGSPLHFANERGVRWINHATLGRKVPEARPMGAVADFVFRPQDVTLCRLSADGDRLLALDARVIEGRHPGFDGSRGWVSQFQLHDERLTLADLVNTVLVEGIEHHFVLASGHHSEALVELAAWSGTRSIDEVPYRKAMQHRAT
jgi:L-fucose isomerase-like protein